MYNSSDGVVGIKVYIPHGRDRLRYNNNNNNNNINNTNSNNSNSYNTTTDDPLLRTTSYRATLNSLTL
jgi:hypothetical protein